MTSSSTPVTTYPATAPAYSYSSPANSTLAGAIGFTGTGSSGLLPSATGNGTVSSPIPSAVPATGNAGTFDFKITLSFIIAVVGAVVLI